MVGDLCAFLHQTGAPLPGLAPVAIQQGLAAAENVLHRLAGQPTRPFHYRDKGSMATIGRAAAVAVIGRVQLSGLLAWVTWLLVHIIHRLPQPRPRAAPVGVGLRQLAARRPPDHRALERAERVRRFLSTNGSSPP